MALRVMVSGRGDNELTVGLGDLFYDSMVKSKDQRQ